MSGFIGAGRAEGAIFGDYGAEAPGRGTYIFKSECKQHFRQVRMLSTTISISKLGNNAGLASGSLLKLVNKLADGLGFCLVAGQAVSYSRIAARSLKSARKSCISSGFIGCPPQSRQPERSCAL